MAIYSDAHIHSTVTHIRYSHGHDYIHCNAHALATDFLVTVVSTLASGYSHCSSNCALYQSLLSTSVSAMNNDLYERSFTDPEGRVYHYDPDQDIYYRRYQPISGWDRFGWLAVTLVLVLAVIYFEYNPIR